jgi:hypothetical protein
MYRGARGNLRLREERMRPNLDTIREGNVPMNQKMLNREVEKPPPLGVGSDVTIVQMFFPEQRSQYARCLWPEWSASRR